MVPFPGESVLLASTEMCILFLKIVLYNNACHSVQKREIDLNDFFFFNFQRVIYSGEEIPP